MPMMQVSDEEGRFIELLRLMLAQDPAAERIVKGVRVKPAGARLEVEVDYETRLVPQLAELSVGGRKLEVLGLRTAGVAVCPYPAETPADRTQRLAFALCELRLDGAADALTAAANTILALGGDSGPAHRAATEAYAALRRQPDGRPQFYADLAAASATVSEPETEAGNPGADPDTVAG